MILRNSESFAKLNIVCRMSRAKVKAPESLRSVHTTLDHELELQVLSRDLGSGFVGCMDHLESDHLQAPLRDKNCFTSSIQAYSSLI